MKPRPSIAIVLVLLSANLAAADVPPCPAPESPALSPPSSTFSVSKSKEDGLYEYTVLIDLKFNDFVLDGVVLAYVSDDDIMLLSNVDSLRLETQAAVNFTVAPSISADVRLLWTYREPKGMCPESVSFQHQFQSD